MELYVNFYFLKLGCKKENLKKEGKRNNRCWNRKIPVHQPLTFGVYSSVFINIKFCISKYHVRHQPIKDWIFKVLVSIINQ